MIGFVTFLHVLICVFLVIVVLMQAGRGGGLTESFSSAESFFGAETSSVMVKTTTVLAAFFIITSLSLAFLSAQKSKSLMSTVATLPGGKSFIEKSLMQKTSTAASKTPTPVVQATQVQEAPKLIPEVQPTPAVQGAQEPQNTENPQASAPLPTATTVTENSAK